MEKTVTKWDKRFMAMAEHISTWSKDRNRKVGVVIVNELKIIVSMGYNGFPRRVDDNVNSRHKKPNKYLYTEHAEKNAIYSASLLGITLKGCTIYCNYFPCADCARAIIQTGISQVVTTKPDYNHETWREHWKAASIMFKEAGVHILFK